jgi:hypothetical protein
MQPSSASVSSNGNPTASFERYLTDTKAVNKDAKQQYYIDASKELWRKLSNCKFSKQGSYLAFVKTHLSCFIY